MPSLIRRRETKKGKVRWLARVPVGTDADGKKIYMRETFDREKDANLLAAGFRVIRVTTNV